MFFFTVKALSVNICVVWQDRSADDTLEHRMAETPRRPLADSRMCIFIGTWARYPGAPGGNSSAAEPQGETGGLNESSVYCVLHLDDITNKNKKSAAKGNNCFYVRISGGAFFQQNFHRF